MTDTVKARAYFVGYIARNTAGEMLHLNEAIPVFPTAKECEDAVADFRNLAPVRVAVIAIEEAAP